ncbi:MAG: RNA polymerase sigma-70 factor [Prolixibacteraceae bacterium]|nr:RNA polymerase sigma-70 factor [Prolixibacteraceae bacterium]
MKSTTWFKTIFDEHYELIRNYLYYLSSDIDVAEDLVQDVFMKLWEKRDSINDQTVKPLLYKIARNLYFNMYKRNSIDLKFVNSAVRGTENESPEYILEMKEFDVKLQKALSDLPEHCRTIFLMSRMDEMKYQEIADSFNISVKAVEKQISKALKLLRTKIDHKL